MSHWSPSVYGGMSIRRPVAGMRRRRAHHGRGIWDTLKNIGSSVGSTLLNVGKDLAVGLIKKKIGLARRRRVGRAKSHNIVSMVHKLGLSRRRVGHAKRRTHHGRGPIGMIGSLLGALGLGRRHHGRAMIAGGRKRRVARHHLLLA